MEPTFQFLLRIPPTLFLLLHLLLRDGQTFNSFSGFHDAQFATNHSDTTLLSIPSPDSTWSETGSQIRHIGGPKLSIPSPDSTASDYQLYFVIDSYLSIPSPDSTYYAIAVVSEHITFNSFSGFHWR